jgi:ABC-type bacteriocin/lantibiotic exporter with double-glycine peptidase domain
VRAFARSQEIVRAVTARLRRMLVDKLQSMSLSFFTRRGAGALSNQVTVDLAKVEAFLNGIVGSFLVGLTIGAGALAYLFWLNPILAGITALAAPAQMLIIRAMRQRVQQLNQRVQQSGENFSERVVEFIGGMRATKSLGNENIAAAQLAESIERMRATGLEASVTMRWMMMVMQFAGEYLGVVVWCIGGVMFLQGTLGLGQLVAFSGLLGFVRGGFNSFFGAYDSWMQAKPGFMAVLSILDSQELEGFRDAPRGVRPEGALELRQMWFRHPGTDEETWSLREINLVIPRGQRVGLVGESWRRRWELNPRMTVLQTIALPLGYSAVRLAREGGFRGLRGGCQCREFEEIAAARAARAWSSSAGVVQSGGMRTMVSRIGRVSRPWARAARQTASPSAGFRAGISSRRAGGVRCRR